MDPTIVYSSPRDTCYAIQRAIKDEFPELVAHAYNRFEPETSLWWLVPTGEWPAYKYGKMFFHWTNPKRTGLWVGFHSEKGLDSSISSVYSTPKALRHIMREDWQWFELVRRISNGEFVNTLKTVASEVTLPFQIRLTGEYVERPADFDPHASPLKRDEYVFEWNRKSSELDLVLVKPEADLLGQLRQIRTFDEFSHHLKLLNSQGWVWVNLTFVVPFAIRKPADPTQGDVWRAPEIWSKFLRRFRHFWF